MSQNKIILENLLEKSSEAVAIFLKERILTDWPTILIDLQDIEKSEDVVFIATKYTTAQEIVDKLKASKHADSFTKIHQIINLQDSIIPDGTFQALYEQTVKHKGDIWVIHKNDADPFPSNPHAHNYAAGLKLHLGTGELFCGSKKANKIKHKHLLELRNLIKNIDLPELVKN